MNIVFMGTPEFAVPHLEKLISDGHLVSCVFTRKDKPAKRGMKLTAPPVKECALKHGIEVYQPAGFKNGKAIEKLKELNPDLIVVVAYGRILPKEVLNLPRYGCVNIHASLLPKYRGAAPINWAVVNGETESGVTAMFMAEELDAGDIIMTRRCPVFPEDTAGDLHDRLMEIGPDLLSDTVKALQSGSVERKPQNEAEATFAPTLSKNDARIDWSKDAESIKNLVRGMNPWPVAWTTLDGVPIKIYDIALASEGSVEAPGTIVEAQNALLVSSGTHVLEIKRLQAPGGKAMLASDYLRGHPLKIGDIFI